MRQKKRLMRYAVTVKPEKQSKQRHKRIASLGRLENERGGLIKKEGRWMKKKE